MARAIKALVPPPPPPLPVAEIVLTLTQDEADMVKSLVGNVLGGGEARRLTDAIFRAISPLATSRFEQRDHIVFNEVKEDTNG